MMKRRAFTLLELMVVLAVITIVGTMTFGVIGNISASNRKLTCSANLSQIYGALRLYAQDYDGEMPYFNPNTKAGQPAGGIGLWALSIYPEVPTGGPANFPSPTAPIQRTGYLRSQEKFHCPSDRFNENRALPTYNSYMQQDDVTPDFTYETFRVAGSKRQLRYFENTSDIPVRRVSDTTVITWCRYHRSLENSTGSFAPAPGATKPDPKNLNRDNVLFYDGRVQSLPTTQLVTQAGSGATGECKGWQRVPLQIEGAVANASACLPAN